MNDDNFRDRGGPREKTRRFLCDDAGAVTVDWVVLTGVIVLLGAAAGFSVSANVNGLADDVSIYMSERDIREN